MSGERQPEYIWDFGRRRRHPGRVWLIVGLTAAAIAIAAALFMMFGLPHMTGGSLSRPVPTSSEVPSAAPAVTPSATPTQTSPATPPPTHTPEPAPAPPSPAPADPGLADFRNKVAPVLEAAKTGLAYAREEGGMAAMQDVMLVQQDAERLTESVAPSSVAQRWADAVEDYARTLEALRSAYERGQDAASADRAATAALNRLNDIVNGR